MSNQSWYGIRGLGHTYNFDLAIGTAHSDLCQALLLGRAMFGLSLDTLTSVYMGIYHRHRGRRWGQRLLGSGGDEDDGGLVWILMVNQVVDVRKIILFSGTVTPWSPWLERTPLLAVVVHADVDDLGQGGQNWARQLAMLEPDQESLALQSKKHSGKHMLHLNSGNLYRWN